jgi:hypothetical protein
MALSELLGLRWRGISTKRGTLRCVINRANSNFVMAISLNWGRYACRHYSTYDLGFGLKPGTSYDTAWQLAEDMQNHIAGIIVE